RPALRPPRPARGSRLRSDSLDSRLSILPPLRPRLPGGKAALAPALAVGQFAACWLPYGCACLAPAAQAAVAEAPVTWVAYSAFAVHPFLYGLLQRPLRRALGRLARRALPRPPRACTPRAWHLPAFLQHLQGPSLGPALGPSEAPEQAPDLPEGETLGMPGAT
ncbi:GPR62 protein, partial [Crocuta crocuta]